MKRIRIPYHHQAKNYTCGPTSLQMVFEFFHRQYSQKHLASVMHTNKQFGTTHKNMISAAQRAGFFVYVNEQSTIHEILHFIHMKIPVIINFLEPEDNEGHYAVVSGYSKDALIVHDPWSGKNTHYLYPNFQKRWHYSLKHNQYPRWIMAISKRDFNIGKQYKPKRNI